MEAHNARCKAKRILEVGGRYGSKPTKNGGRGSHHRRRGHNLHPQGKSVRLNKITRYFKSNSSKISKSERDHSSFQKKPGDEDLEKGRRPPKWLSISTDSDQILMASVAPKLQASITATLNTWGRYRWGAHWTLRLHHHEAEDELILMSSYRPELLNSIKMMILDCFLPEGVSDLCSHMPLLCGKVPEGRWDEAVPVAIYYTDWREDVQCHLMQKTEVMTHLFLTIRDDPHANSQNLAKTISKRDFELFKNASLRYRAYRAENMLDWARVQMVKMTIVTFTDRDNTNEDLFLSLSALSQLTYPGKSVIQAHESCVKWDITKDEKLCARERNGEWVSTVDTKELLSTLWPEVSARRYVGQRHPLFPTYWDEGVVKTHTVLPKRRPVKDALEEKLTTIKEERDKFSTELKLVNRTVSQVTKHNETLLKQKAEVEKRLSDASGRPLSGFYLSGEEERRIKDKV